MKFLARRNKHFSTYDELVLGVPWWNHSSTICCDRRPLPVSLPYHLHHVIFLKGVYPHVRYGNHHRLMGKKW